MPPEHPAPPPHPVPEWDCYIKVGKGPRNRADPHLSNYVYMGGRSWCELTAHEQWTICHPGLATLLYMGVMPLLGVALGAGVGLLGIWLLWGPH